MTDDSLWTIFINACLVNNFVLAYFLGICPFLGVSGKLETASRMGGAVTFVMLVSSICAFGIQALLVAIDAPYLKLISFIAVIASTVQLVEMFIKKVSPALFRSLGIFLPLITTNCAILGLGALSDQQGLQLRAVHRLCPRRRRGLHPGPRAHGRPAREARAGRGARRGARAPPWH